MKGRFVCPMVNRAMKIEGERQLLNFETGKKKRSVEIEEISSSFMENVSKRSRIK